MQRLPASPRPESYDLDLHVDPAASGYRGSVEIALALAHRTREIELHAVDLELEHCEVADGRGSARVRRVSPRPARETVVLALEREVGPGRATLRIRFAGPLRTDLRGLYLAASGGRRYAVTQLEAAAARRFFPCFDEPDRKARFRLTVATPARNEVVSNAPVESTQTRGGEKVVRFAQTPKLSSYLVALVVGELAASPVRLCGKTPIRVWHVPEKSGLADFALEAAVESLARLERYFALPYPYAKLDLLAVPDFEFGAMENAGAVVFRETLLLLDPKTATLRERKRVAEVIAHELAHMWYGDLVTMAWWDDLWLNEAFATWMAFTIVDQWKPEWKMWLDFEQHRAGALAADALKNTHPVYVAVNTPDEATENFDVITYEKGAAVVRMLERWLGPATFRRGVRRYIRRHRESNATAADLWRALAEAAGKPVAPVVRAWIERPGFPLVSVQRTDRDGRARLDLAQERFFASPREPAKARRARWPIPLVVRVAPLRGNTRVVRDLVRGARGRLDLGPSGRVAFAYANAEESGFIRPLHAGPLLATIASELARLEPSERMGLASHQWAGLRANRAPLGDFLALVQPLADEREPDVLESLVGPLATLDDLVAPAAGPEAVAALRLRVAARFLPRFRALGWDSAPGEEDAARLRRAVLLRIAGGIAHAPELESEAARRVEAYLRDRGSLDPNLATPTVELAARGGDARLWETYRKTFEEARIPQERTRFEMALASFTRPELVARTLELALGESVPTQDVVPLLGRLLENPAAREATWRFVRERWDALQPRVPSGLASRLVAALPLLQTREHRAEVVAFFKAHPLPTAKRALRQALERFDLNAEFARRAAPALAQWLELSTPGSALEPRARGRGRGR
jgi:puromycin-sensitive aminopeptidase